MLGQSRACSVVYGIGSNMKTCHSCDRGRAFIMSSNCTESISRSIGPTANFLFVKCIEAIEILRNHPSHATISANASTTSPNQSATSCIMFMGGSISPNVFVVMCCFVVSNIIDRIHEGPYYHMEYQFLSVLLVYSYQLLLQLGSTIALENVYSLELFHVKLSR